MCFTNTDIQTKYLVSILELLNKKKHNQITVKDSFNFATEIVEQDSSSFMVSLDIDSLLTSILLEETIEICTSNLFKSNNIVHGVNKMNLKIFYL